jgi:hypothetical protein
MAKLDRTSTAILRDEGTAGLAFAIERHFTDLLAIFDRQLASLPPADAEVRQHVIAARTAVERGLELSRKIVCGLQS